MEAGLTAERDERRVAGVEAAVPDCERLHAGLEEEEREERVGGGSWRKVGAL